MLLVVAAGFEGLEFVAVLLISVLVAVAVAVVIVVVVVAVIVDVVVGRKMVRYCLGSC